MGMDLSLVPVDIEGQFPYGHTVLSCEAGGYLQDLIDLLPKFDVPVNFACYLAHNESDGSTCYGKLDSHDAYGRPIRCVAAGDLATLDISGSSGRLNRNSAVWAYLKLLPPETKIVVIYS